MDHIAGLAYYLSQRNFQGMKPGTVLVPAELYRAVEGLLKCWREVERQGTPYVLVPMRAGESHEVRRGPRRFRATPIEYRILYSLMLNVGRVVSSSRLVEQAWGFEGGDPSMLKTHISHLRKKLGLVKGEAGYIEGIPGIGYILHV